MLSGSSWQRWRRTLLALFFIVQYHCRMSFLSLRYKARHIPRAEMAAQAREHWNQLCQALAAHKTFGPLLQTTKRTLEHEHLTGTLRAIKQNFEHEQLTGALRAVRRNLEDERLHSALDTAKKRLEHLLFVEETPTQPMDLSSLERLKTAWHSLETSKIARVTPDALKAARQSFVSRKIARLAPATLKAARHPRQTLKTARRHPTALVMLLLISLFLVALLAASGIFEQTLRAMKHATIPAVSRLSTSALNLDAHEAPAVNASKALARLSQLDEGEYASQNEYNTWAYSACSTASLTEVFNAYGRHYRITDVLKVESDIGEITPQLGLVENAGIANTATKFGFKTDWGNNWTLDEVLSIANLGRPVIVGWPHKRYDGGHIVVVTGGNANEVYLADSSLWDRHVLSRMQFLQWWGGFAAVVMPE